MTLSEICAELTRLGIPTRRRGGRWHTSVVHKLLKRTEPAFRSLAHTAECELSNRPCRSPLKDQARARHAAIGPLAWRLRAEGRSTRAIADELNRIEAPAARTHWGSAMIRTVLRATAEQCRDVASNALPVIRAIGAARHARTDARLRVAAPIVWGCLYEGKTRGEIAVELNRKGCRTARDLPWTEASTARLIKSIAAQHFFDEEAGVAADVAPARLRWMRMARELGPRILEDQGRGKSFDRIAADFTREQIPTLRRERWHGQTVEKLLRFGLTSRILAATASGVSGVRRTA